MMNQCPQRAVTAPSLNPEAWLDWVLERIQDFPVKRIAELLPWAYQDMIDAAERNAEAANAA